MPPLAADAAAFADAALDAAEDLAAGGGVLLKDADFAFEGEAFIGVLEEEGFSSCFALAAGRLEPKIAFFTVSFTETRVASFEPATFAFFLSFFDEAGACACLACAFAAGFVGDDLVLIETNTFRANFVGCHAAIAQSSTKEKRTITPALNRRTARRAHKGYWLARRARSTFTSTEPLAWI